MKLLTRFDEENFSKVTFCECWRLCLTRPCAPLWSRDCHCRSPDQPTWARRPRGESGSKDVGDESDFKMGIFCPALPNYQYIHFPLGKIEKQVLVPEFPLSRFPTNVKFLTVNREEEFSGFSLLSHTDGSWFSSPVSFVVLSGSERMNDESGLLSSAEDLVTLIIKTSDPSFPANICSLLIIHQGLISALLSAL